MILSKVLSADDHNDFKYDDMIYGMMIWYMIKEKKNDESMMTLGYDIW